MKTLRNTLVALGLFMLWAQPTPAQNYDWDKPCRDAGGFCVNTAETCCTSYNGTPVNGSELCQSDVLPQCCRR